MDAQQLRDALGAVRPAEPLGSFHCGDWVLGRLAVARHGADIVRDIAADKKRAEIHPRLRRHFADSGNRVPPALVGMPVYVDMADPLAWEVRDADGNVTTSGNLGPVHDAVVIPKVWDSWAGITVHLLCEDMPRAFRWIDASGEGDRCPNCQKAQLFRDTAGH